MTDTRALLELPGVGRVLGGPLGLRTAGAGRLEESPSGLAPGLHRVGAVGLRVDLDRGARELTARVRVANRASRPLHLEAVVLGFRFLPEGPGPLRLLEHGWQSWSPCRTRGLDDPPAPAFPSGAWLRGFHHARGEVPPDRAGWHESHLLSAVGSSPPAGGACVIGVLERGESFGVIYLRRMREAVALEAELVVDADLDPGEVRELEGVRVALGTDTAALLEEQAERHGRRAGARTHASPGTGWCTWYHFFHGVREDDVLRNLDALAALREELPVSVVQLDDGYQHAIGDWTRTNEKFPRGLEPLARDIRSAGFVPGLWTAPLLAAPDSDLFAEHPDWVLRNAGEPLLGLLHPAWTKDARIFVLDTTRPEVLAHLEATFRALREMGFEYHKLDFLYAAAMRGEAEDPGPSRAARLRRGLEAVRRGCGEDAFVLGCGCPLGPAVGVVDAMRIGPDVAPRWEPDPAAAIPGIEETQPSTRFAVRSIFARAFLHRRLFVNDPDCLLARRCETELGEGEIRALAAAIAGTGGMVLFSDDLGVLGEEDRARVAEVARVAAEVDAAGGARCLDPLGDPERPTAVAALPEARLVAAARLGEGEELRELSVPPGAAGVPEPLLGSPPRARVEGRRLRLRLGPREGSLYRLPRRLPFAVFCDFDGTFAVQDVGATLALRYAGDRRPALWARFERGEITAWEYNLELLDGIEIPEDELEDFLATVELSPGARELVAWCEDRGIPFRILSDGFDRNLERLRVLTGVPFAYDANRLRYERGRWRIEPAGPDPRCSCGTGLCKRARIEAFRRRHPGVPVVYIGNGRVSDRCGALASELVFAKDSLAEVLRAEGVDFVSYQTLAEVLAELERRFGLPA